MTSAGMVSILAVSKPTAFLIEPVISPLNLAKPSASRSVPLNSGSVVKSSARTTFSAKLRLRIDSTSVSTREASGAKPDKTLVKSGWALSRKSIMTLAMEVYCGVAFKVPNMTTATTSAKVIAKSTKRRRNAMRISLRSTKSCESFVGKLAFGPDGNIGMCIFINQPLKLPA